MKASSDRSFGGFFHFLSPFQSCFLYVLMHGTPLLILKYPSQLQWLLLDKDHSLEILLDLLSFYFFYCPFEAPHNKLGEKKGRNSNPPYCCKNFFSYFHSLLWQSPPQHSGPQSPIASTGQPSIASLHPFSSSSFSGCL